MKQLLISLFVLSLSTNIIAIDKPCNSELKPRLVVLTDIGPADVEPDDNESAVRLLAYADCFEIEAICPTIGWNCDPYPQEWVEYLYKVVDAYEVDVKNLMKRSKQETFKPIAEESQQQTIGYWPSADYIRSRIAMGSPKAGIGVIGEGNDTDGSNLLIKLALEDDQRPIWVASWGGANTLSQAIWRYKQTATQDELKKFLQKFRLYTITDQDMVWAKRMDRAYSSHQWLRSEFADDLLIIWDESAWLNQNELGSANWNMYEKHIQSQGAMGKVYPKFKYGVEGDTPSMLHILPNGLNNPDDPTQVGWGGYHTFNISPDNKTYAWTNWQQPQKDISDAYEKQFYPDEFNDFAARMKWANNGSGNHNPIVVVNDCGGVAPIVIDVETLGKVTLNASKSYDVDNDSLSFFWWQQPEAGSYNKPVEIVDNKSTMATITMPTDAKGKSVHIICEVRDNGDFNLVSYRRIIINIK